MSLRTRIAAAAGLAVAVAVVAAAVAVYVGVRAELRAEVDRSLRDHVERPGRPGHRPPGFGFGRPPEAPPLPFGGAIAYAQLVRPDGEVVGRRGSSGRLPVSGRALEIARSGEGEELTDMTVDGTHLRVLTVPAPRGGALQVARPLGEVDSQLRRVVVVLLLVGVGGVALAVALGMAVARTALAPVERFTRRTERLTADPDPGARIEVEGSDELARLARSFNTTLDALERSVEAQRHLVADASHELRTPIASLRANIQTLEQAERLPPEEREGLRRDVIQELDELTALVGDVVELARGAKPGELVDDVRLDEIADAVVARARARVDGTVDIRLRSQPTLVRGEPQRVQRAISNLVDNAVKWSPPGGLVEVDVAGGAVKVRDHGPGFAERDLPHVFERFYRAEAARGMPGSGLGLAIVRLAAEAHGGTATAANAPGGGALLEVSFGSPLQPAESQPITGA